MNFKGVTDYHNSSWLHYGSADMEGAYITKPVDPKQVVSNYKKIKALQLEFDKKAFSEKFDASVYLQEWFNVSDMEFYEITRGHKMTYLPDVKAKQGIKYLNLHIGKINNLGNVLPKLKQLVQLQLYNGGFMVQLGHNFGALKHLKMLKIQSKNLIDLEEIWKLENLEYLSLNIEELDTLPKELGQLKKLKYLIVKSDQLQHIHCEIDLPELEYLKVNVSGHLTDLPFQLFSPKLIEISVRSSGEEKKLQFPDCLYLPALQKLYLSGKNIREFPELYTPELKELELNISCSKIFKQIKDASKIEELILENSIEDNISDLRCNTIKKYWGKVFRSSSVMDFGCWPELEEIRLKGGENNDIFVAKNSQLKRLEFRENNFLKQIGEMPENLEDLSIVAAKNLTHASLTQKLDHLKAIKINKCSALEEVNLNGVNNRSLEWINIDECPNIRTINPNLMCAPNLRFLYVRACGTDAVDEELIDAVREIQKLRKKHGLTSEEMWTIAYWIFKHYSQVKSDNEIKWNSLSLLRFANDTIFRLISKNFNFFSEQKKKLSDFDVKLLQGKKICILGNTYQTKTVLKQKCKDLGMKPTTKIEQSDFILLAKKAILKNPPPLGAVFLIENELHVLHEKNNPKFLQQETTDLEQITNLRKMLWSTDSKVELLALEMMKHGGMPYEVLGECIAIAKTSKNASVKSKYKSFLKGQVSADIFKLVSKNIRFDLITNNPFWGLAKLFPIDVVGKLALALYKRTSHYWSDVLEYNSEDMEIRMEIVNRILILKVMERPHYIKLYYNLTDEELSKILKLPDLKGKVKRLHFRTRKDYLPSVLAEHKSIKELVINGKLKATSLPDELFALTRVSILKINAPMLNKIDKRILNLKELKEIIIYSDTPIQYPEEMEKMPKIKRIYFSEGKVKI